MIYSSPEAKSKFTKDGKVGFEFDKEVLTSKTGVTLGFGDTQIFSFTLNYHLENPLNKEAKTKIALPPDTSFQRVFYESIEPKPKNILIDNDGNWLAEYYLSQEKLLMLRQLVLPRYFLIRKKFYRKVKILCIKTHYLKLIGRQKTPELKILPKI